MEPCQRQIGDRMMLTDEQCDEFRRLPLSFNDMVRAIYSAGQKDMRERAANRCLVEAKSDELCYQNSGNSYNEGGMDTSYLLEEEIRNMEIEE